MKLSLLVTLARAPGEALVDEGCQHAFGDAAGGAGFVDDEDSAGGVGFPQNVFDRQRREPAHVHDAGGDVRASESAGDSQAHVEAVAERHDRQVGAVVVGAGLAERNVAAAGVRVAGEPLFVAVFVKVAGVVERDRFEVDAHGPGVVGGGRAGVHHRGGVVGAGGGGDDEPGDVPECSDGVVVVEVAAESLLVAVSRDPHDHRVAILAVGEELQRGTFAPDLVGGVVQVGEVLDFGDGQQARRAGTQGQAEDRLFVEKGVENPCWANLFHQSAGDAVDAALAGDILAEEQCFRVVGEDVAAVRG